MENIAAYDKKKITRFVDRYGNNVVVIKINGEEVTRIVSSYSEEESEDITTSTTNISRKDKYFNPVPYLTKSVIIDREDGSRTNENYYSDGRVCIGKTTTNEEFEMIDITVMINGEERHFSMTKGNRYSKNNRGECHLIDADTGKEILSASSTKTQDITEFKKKFRDFDIIVTKSGNKTIASVQFQFDDKKTVSTISTTNHIKTNSSGTRMIFSSIDIDGNVVRDSNNNDDVRYLKTVNERGDVTFIYTKDHCEGDVRFTRRAFVNISSNIGYPNLRITGRVRNFFDDPSYRIDSDVHSRYYDTYTDERGRILKMVSDDGYVCEYDSLNWTITDPDGNVCVEYVYDEDGCASSTKYYCRDNNNKDNVLIKHVKCTGLDEFAEKSSTTVYTIKTAGDCPDFIKEIPDEYCDAKWYFENMIIRKRGSEIWNTTN